MRKLRRSESLVLAAAAALAGVASQAGAQTTFGTFSGPAPGQGLDLSGTFPYAIDIGGPATPGTLQGVTFTDDDATPGATVSSSHNDFTYQSPTYNGGASAEDTTLAAITSTIEWSQPGDNPNGAYVTLTNLVPNTPYKLQLLFQDDNRGTSARVFDVTVNGATIAHNFPSSTGNLTSGTLITHQFTATGSTLNIVASGVNTTAGSDNNAILSALTLEDLSPVPEPGCAGLLALAGGGMLLRRRRHRSR